MRLRPRTQRQKVKLSAERRRWKKGQNIAWIYLYISLKVIVSASALDSDVKATIETINSYWNRLFFVRATADPWWVAGSWSRELKQTNLLTAALIGSFNFKSSVNLLCTFSGLGEETPVSGGNSFKHETNMQARTSGRFELGAFLL